MKEWEKENIKREKKNQVNELVNTVESFTRTERHLEQHSDISSHEALEHTKGIQRKRGDDIATLKNRIVNGSNADENTNELENLEENYKYAEGYLKHNAEHMNKHDLEALKDKQENRRDQMNRLQ